MNEAVATGGGTTSADARVAPKSAMSKFGRELNAILTIAARDIAITLKTPELIFFNLVMSLFFMGFMGGSLEQNMAGHLGFDYKPFMLVGMLVNALFMMTSLGITSLVEDRKSDFTQEMFVSPISRYSLVLGKIIGAPFSSVSQLLGIMGVAFIMEIYITPGQLLSLLLVAPLVCLVAGSVALVIVSFIRNERAAHMAAMFLVFPQLFLSGVLIPLNQSSGVLYVLSRLMPMTYCLDLARALFYSGLPEYSAVVMNPPVWNLGILACFTAVFLMVGTYCFVRSETRR